MPERNKEFKNSPLEVEEIAFGYDFRRNFHLDGLCMDRREQNVQMNCYLQ